MNRRFLFALPVLLFAAIAAVIAFFMLSGKDSRIVPSALIDQPVPDFVLPGLDGPGTGFSTADLRGGVTVVNVFASWCYPCRVEHPQIARLAKDQGIRVFGLDYKDRPEDAKAWLARMGNPYARIGVDRDGRISIDWGVYGVPETFIIDRQGRIRYKHVGPILADDLDDILPIIEELKR